MIVFHGLTDLALDTEYSVPADIGKTRPVPMSLVHRPEWGRQPARAGAPRPIRAPGQCL